MITNDLEIFLKQRKEQCLYRSRQINDNKQLIFCSNDYLGLSSQNYQLNQQIGSGSAHLVCGHHDIHHELELALAKFTGYQKTLLFSTGYMANIGVISALMGRNDAIFLDNSMSCGNFAKSPSMLKTPSEMINLRFDVVFCN